MEKKNIVVTGANGYIGHNVVKHLLDNGFNVTAVDMNNNNISEDVAFKNVKETLLYQLLKNKKTDLFLKPKEYIEEAYRLEKTQSQDAMMEFLTNPY